MIQTEEQNFEIIEDTKTFDDYLKESKNRYRTQLPFKIRSDYYDAYNKYEIDNHMIMYEAFFGRGITCNTAALFYYLLEDERFKDFTHVWSLEKGDFFETIVEMYKDRKNVIFVETFSLEYYKYLSTAKYLINNVTWQNYFIKKPSQVVINTWHGIPLKHIGFDIPDGIIAAENMIRNFLLTDYVISPVPYMTEIYRSAFKLDGLFPGKIIETGYPRVDSTFNVDRVQFSEELKRFGVSFDPGKKLVLYAPTYREDQYAKPDYSAIDEYNYFLEKISGYLDLNEYQILFKPHQIVYKKMMENGSLQDNFIPAVVDTNKLLGVTDVLISDYSSIFFDFLVTGRPILFYISDFEEYSDTRGLYFSIDKLPGPVSEDLDQIGYWLQHLDHYSSFFDYNKYTEAAELYTNKEDGKSCERVVDAVFFSNDAYNINIDKTKTSILFHTDICKRNGISSSLINLLDKLDYDKYDVTFYAIGPVDFLREYCERLRPEVRVIKRVGARVCNIEENAKVEYCVNHAITLNDNSELYPNMFYELEYKRIFGDAKFDYIINFSGTSAFWADLYAAQNNTIRIIWMHSVVMKEYNRPVNGEYILRRSLNSIFKLYKLFDLCVSCSHATMLINMRDLEERGVSGNFGYARNLFNSEAVLNGSNNYLMTEIDDTSQKYFIEESKDGTSVFIPMPDEKKVTFVTMGRLGVEKNHLNLVKAFGKLHKEFPNTELYIIGDGELAGELKQLSQKSGVSQDVVLTGNLANPFAIMKKCDCFILPSFHEGQPMVILEARTLYLPIIVSDFESVTDSSYENGQLIIGTSEEDIYEGMKAFMEGRVPNEYHLDIQDYNKKALEEFEACLENARKHKEGIS